MQYQSTIHPVPLQLPAEKLNLCSGNNLDKCNPEKVIKDFTEGSNCLGVLGNWSL
jgi:hypothetical protein